MIQKLITKAKFAQLAGVSGAAVTKASASILKPAMVGDRVDANHVLAKQYVKKRQNPDIDHQYEEVKAACIAEGKYSLRWVKRTFSMGQVRARRILNRMADEGVEFKQHPKPANVKRIPSQETEVKKPHVRGTAAAKLKRKAEAAAQPLDGMLEIPEDIQAFADMPLRDLVAQFGTDQRFVDWLSAIQKIEMINERRLKNAATEGKLVSRELIKQWIVEPFDECHIKILTDGAKKIAKRSLAMAQAGSDETEIEAFIKDQIGSFIKPAKAKIAKGLRNA